MTDDWPSAEVLGRAPLELNARSRALYARFVPSEYPLVAFRKAGVLYWAGTDHLGGTVRTLDAGFSVVDSSRYVAFGADRDPASALKTDRKFTGQTQDRVSGLYFYKSRYYDQALGRFVQPDSVVPSPKNPQSLNRYSYVLNNPVTYTDPSGHSAESGWDHGSYDTWGESDYESSGPNDPGYTQGESWETGGGYDSGSGTSQEEQRFQEANRDMGYSDSSPAEPSPEPAPTPSSGSSPPTSGTPVPEPSPAAAAGPMTGESHGLTVGDIGSAIFTGYTAGAEGAANWYEWQRLERAAKDWQATKRFGGFAGPVLDVIVGGVEEVGRGSSMERVVLVSVATAAGSWAGGVVAGRTFAAGGALVGGGIAGPRGAVIGGGLAGVVGAVVGAYEGGDRAKAEMRRELDARGIR